MGNDLMITNEEAIKLLKDKLFRGEREIRYLRKELKKIDKEAIKKTNNILKRLHSQEEVTAHNKGYNIWYLPIKRLINKFTLRD